MGKNPRVSGLEDLDEKDPLFVRNSYHFVPKEEVEETEEKFRDYSKFVRNEDDAERIEEAQKLDDDENFRFVLISDNSDDHRDSTREVYKCGKCFKSFNSRNLFEDHKVAHSGGCLYQCDTCDKTSPRQDFPSHAKLHQPDCVPPKQKHICELCNKSFSRKQILRVHMHRHSIEGPQNKYVCHICGKAVSSNTYLTIHVRKHTGEKPHVCDLCNKSFISRNYLRVHRRTHTGERPHQCTHCDKRFTQRTSLVIHLRRHTGDRPYSCTFCEKFFASNTLLNGHLKTHAKQNAKAQQAQQDQQIDQQTQDSQQTDDRTQPSQETFAVLLSG